MKKHIRKRLIAFSLAICIAIGMAGLFPITSYAEYGWESAFYNDMDGDGDKELLPYIYTGTSAITSEYFYTLYNCVPYDSEKYGGTTAEEDEVWTETYEELVETYGDECEPDQRDDCYALLAAKLGDGTDAYYAAIVKYEAYWKMDDEYCKKNIAAQKLWQADQTAYKNAHPEINFGHTVNDALTNTVKNPDETLLYWLHVPYDYDPEKSYPVFVLANGEWSTWNKFTYLNDDGTYKSDKFDPPDSYQMNTIMNSWYNLVKNPGENREKYDCFFIYMLNTNEFFRGENGSIAIVNQYNDNAIPEARTLTTDDTGDTTYNGGYRNTYVADELSPGYQEQLVCQLIDTMMLTYNIDPSRQYVSGFSLGGIFTMDIISHYPDRFAAAVPICTAASDITEENCKALTYTNVWAISGNNDTNCNKYHSKLFVDKINECREKYQTGLNHVAQYSFYAGGHTGGQAQCRAVTAAAGVSQTSSTHLMEFIFNSQREDMDVEAYKANNEKGIEGIKQNVNLTTDFEMNLYIPLTEGREILAVKADGAKIAMTEIELQGSPYMKTTYAVSADRAGEPVEFSVSYLENGIAQKPYTFTTSAALYARGLSKTEEYHDLAVSMLRYAKSAALYTQESAPAALNVTDATTHTAQAEAVSTIASSSGIVSASVSLANGTPVFVFGVSGVEGTVTIEYDGAEGKQTVTREVLAEDTSFTAAGIKLYDFAETLTVSVNGETAGQYNLSAYAASLTDENAKSLVTSLYDYIAEAREYFIYKREM